ncbi:MAG: hypothetical protein VX460_11015, partial [Planctomycetota bacterium]|nr:hypothetical protein [Planctomycetota bacterium]
MTNKRDLLALSGLIAAAALALAPDVHANEGEANEGVIRETARKVVVGGPFGIAPPTSRSRAKGLEPGGLDGVG